MLMRRFINPWFSYDFVPTTDVMSTSYEMTDESLDIKYMLPGVSLDTNNATIESKDGVLTIKVPRTKVPG